MRRADATSQLKDVKIWNLRASGSKKYLDVPKVTEDIAGHAMSQIEQHQADHVESEVRSPKQSAASQ